MCAHACDLELVLLCLHTLIKLDVKRHNEAEAAAPAHVESEPSRQDADCGTHGWPRVFRRSSTHSIMAPLAVRTLNY